MWRAIFLAVGLTLCLWGLECLVVDQAVLAGPATEGSASIAPPLALGSAAQQRTIEPPEWAPWSLLSAGGIVVLYSLMLKKPAGGEAS